MASLRLARLPEVVCSPGVDALALLDYRERRRAVPAECAPPGRYLAFEGAAETMLIALSGPVTHIGRGLVADVRVEHPRVARLHAIVVQHADCARALAGRSGEGLLVNGRRVAATALRDGDVIGVGPITIRFVEIAATYPTEPGEAQIAGRIRPRARRAGHSRQHVPAA